MMKKVRFFVIFFLLVFTFFSCHEYDYSKEKKMFKERWNDVILKTGNYKNYGSSYYVVTDKREISIVPIQPIIMYGEAGDSIVKESNSFIVDVYRNGEIKFSSRIFSSTVDTLVIPGYKFKTFEELKFEHPYLTW